MEEKKTTTVSERARLLTTFREIDLSDASIRIIAKHIGSLEMLDIGYL